MTSIVVHGVTIPIGKGFERTYTLTITRSTQVTQGNVVSRLPPAAPFGQTLPTVNTSSSSSTRTTGLDGHGGMDSEATIDAKEVLVDELTVRFREPSTAGPISQLEDGSSTTSSRVQNVAPGVNVQWSDRLVSAGNTPLASGRNTPILLDGRASPLSSGRTTPDIGGAGAASAPRGALASPLKSPV